MSGDEQQQEQAGWQFTQDDTSAVETVDMPIEQPRPEPVKHRVVGPSEVSWTASEFIHHEKNASWYMTLGLSVVLVAGVMFLLTRDYIATGMIVLLAIFFGMYAARKPRTLPYRLDGKGLMVGEKLYGYDAFRSFSVGVEGVFPSITLMPLKRFAPALTVYCAPVDADKVVKVLSNYLPFEKHQGDLLDQFLHYIRF